MHRARIAAAVVAAAMAAAGCGGDDNGGGGGDEKLTIGVSLASPTIPLYVAMADGMKRRAAEIGVELKFTEANEDPAQQLNDVQDLISQGVDGILISPIDAEAAVPAYEDARAAGIKVMSIARNTDPKVEDSFIGASWKKYGHDIAAWTCKKTGGKATVALVKGPAGASFVEEMVDGYKGYLSSSCAGMKIVSESNADTLTSEKGLAVAQDALSANPGVDVIFANNDDLAKGAIQALEERRRVGKVIVTGFDGTPSGVEQIRKGEQSMTIALRPYQWGRLGLDTMVRALRGEKVGKLVGIDTTLIDEGNVEQIDDADIR